MNKRKTNRGNLRGQVIIKGYTSDLQKLRTQAEIFRGQSKAQGSLHQQDAFRNRWHTDSSTTTASTQSRNLKPRLKSKRWDNRMNTSHTNKKSKCFGRVNNGK